MAIALSHVHLFCHFKMNDCCVHDNPSASLFLLSEFLQFFELNVA